MRTVHHTKTFNKYIPPVLALIAGLMSGFVAWVMAPTYRVAVAGVFLLLVFFTVSLFLSFLATLLSSLSDSMNRQFDYLMKCIYQTEEEIRSLITIRPLLGNTLVSFNGWAIEARTGEQLALLLRELSSNPGSTGLVVECGSGASTFLIAHCLKKGGRGKVISLEHEKSFAETTRKVLEEGGLGGVASVVYAPLRPWILNGQETQWYDVDLDSRISEKIDLLVVDGPPGQTAPIARYPALPRFRDQLRPGSIVLLHDAHREDEKKIAEMWSEELGVVPELYPNGKGVWLIRLPA